MTNKKGFFTTKGNYFFWILYLFVLYNLYLVFISSRHPAWHLVYNFKISHNLQLKAKAIRKEKLIAYIRRRIKFHLEERDDINIHFVLHLYQKKTLSFVQAKSASVCSRSVLVNKTVSEVRIDRKLFLFSKTQRRKTFFQLNTYENLSFGTQLSCGYWIFTYQTMWQENESLIFDHHWKFV